MKKRIVISAIICLGIMLCIMTSCSPKTPQTVSGFTEVMEAAGFEVQDVTADIEENGLATAVIIATCKDYQIEFFELIDSDTGESVFYNSKQVFLDEHAIHTLSREANVGDYNYYAFNADDDFHIIARIDNTMIYCEAEEEYKEEIVEFVKTLGYK